MDEAPNDYDEPLGERAIARALASFAKRDGYEIIAQLMLLVLVAIVAISIASGIIFLTNGDSTNYTGSAFNNSLAYFCQFGSFEGVSLVVLFVAFVEWRVRCASSQIPADVLSRDVHETDELFARCWYWRLFCRANIALALLGFIASLGAAYYDFVVIGGSYNSGSALPDVSIGGGAVIVGIVWIVAVAAAWIVHRECDGVLDQFVPIAAEIREDNAAA